MNALGQAAVGATAGSHPGLGESLVAKARTLIPTLRSRERAAIAAELESWQPGSS
jgi:hypothetical protein